MSLKIQSVIIPKSKFSEKQATAFIIKNGFTTAGKRIKNYKTTNFYRFRQRPPSHFDKSTFKTKKYSNGVEIIIGKLMKK